MRIIHFYDEHSKVAPGWGSVVTVILNLSRQMAAMGHDVTIVERRWAGTKDVELYDGVNFKRFNLLVGSNIPGKDLPYKMVRTPFGLLKMVLDRVEFSCKLSSYLNDRDFDVLHVHVPFAANILVKLDKKIGDKIVYTFHAGEEKKRLDSGSGAPIALRIFSPDLHIMKKAKICTVLNPSLKQALVKRGIDEDKIWVIPNGVNLEEFGHFDEHVVENIKRKYGIPTDKILIMFAGTITPRKGVIYLLRALDIILKRGYKNVFLILTGNTDIDKYYFDYVNNFVKNNLSGYVKFTGKVPYTDLKILYSACDVFVLPSLEEGFGLALTEAMASGKPLVGSNVGGITMQIRDGWNGLLIKPGDVKALAEGLAYLIDNCDIRKIMGRNSLSLAKKEFDWARIAEKYVKAYESIV